MRTGWDFKFISNNFTLTQIKRYFEEIRKVENEDTVNLAYLHLHACATGFGNMKIEKFDEYIKIFMEKDSRTMDREIERAKAEGLIEEN